jgi:hypothetical protein
VSRLDPLSFLLSKKIGLRPFHCKREENFAAKAKKAEAKAKKNSRPNYQHAADRWSPHSVPIRYPLDHGVVVSESSSPFSTHSASFVDSPTPAMYATEQHTPALQPTASTSSLNLPSTNNVHTYHHQPSLAFQWPSTFYYPSSLYYHNPSSSYDASNPPYPEHGPAAIYPGPSSLPSGLTMDNLNSTAMYYYRYPSS